MVNAWETLLKARIVQQNSNNIKAIYKEDKSARTKQGRPYKHPKYLKNRAGNYMTIDIFRCINILQLDSTLKENIELLIEIRDNAIHFYNESKSFEKKVLEIGTASLKSYVACVSNWFQYDMTQYNFYLMPISFFHSQEYESYSINAEDKQHQNLMNYIAQKEGEHPSDTAREHNISLILETKFVRSSSTPALNFAIDSASPVSIAINAEEQFQRKYPWSYQDELKPRLLGRYPNISFNRDFWKLLKTFQKDDNLCKERYLDWKKKKGTKKWFYSPNILKEFDKYYTPVSDT